MRAKIASLSRTTTRPEIAGGHCTDQGEDDDRDDQAKAGNAEGEIILRTVARGNELADAVVDEGNDQPDDVEGDGNGRRYQDPRRENRP
jgi:hypothetical protein